MAGWLYADVFLALMIMGVGSSVVVRQMVPSDLVSPPPAAANTPTAIVSCNEMAVRLDAATIDGTDDELSRVISDAMNAEITQRGWSVDGAQPALVIVLGGFELYESAGDGDANARALRTRLQRVVPILAEVEMRTGGSRSVMVNNAPVNVGNSGEFVLVVYLLHTFEREMECV